MQCVNLIIVYNKTKNKVLMCHRQTNPYKGLYNFVGGKTHPNEDEFEAAYRELEEETSIQKKDIDLRYLFKTVYFNENIELQVFYGVLKKEVQIVEELHPLIWMDLSLDFTNNNLFAGEGNIQHMLLLSQVELRNNHSY